MGDQPCSYERGYGASRATTTSQGRDGVRPSRLHLREAGDVEPAALLPRFEADFGELDALGAVEQRPAEGFVEDDVAEEEFPLDLEGVVVGFLLGHLGPAVVEVD